MGSFFYHILLKRNEKVNDPNDLLNVLCKSFQVKNQNIIIIINQSI